MRLRAEITIAALRLLHRVWFIDALKKGASGRHKKAT